MILERCLGLQRKAEADVKEERHVQWRLMEWCRSHRHLIHPLLQVLPPRNQNNQAGREGLGKLGEVKMIRFEPDLTAGCYI